MMCKAIIGGVLLMAMELGAQGPRANVLEFKRPRQLSLRYIEGPYLVYDCVDLHFVCVNEESFENCQARRESSFISRSALLACAPLKKMESFKYCRERAYEFIHSAVSTPFCINYRQNDTHLNFSK